MRFKKSSKSKLSGLAAVGVLAIAGSVAQAQVGFDADGTTVMFDSLPAPTEFGTNSVSGAAGDVDNATELDAIIFSGVAASGVNQQMAEDTANPPTQANALFLYNSTNDNVQSRPTGVTASLLLGNFRNDSGQDIQGVSVRFDLLLYNAAVEQMPGYRIYYSETGGVTTFQPVPGHDPATETFATPGANSFDINVPLAAGAPLFLLIVDDNADGGTEGNFAIDNLEVAVIPEPATLGLVVLGATGLLARRRRA